MVDKPVTIRIEPREDGGIRVWSPDLPGLVLSGLDKSAVMLDILPAIEVMQRFAGTTPEANHG